MKAESRDPDRTQPLLTKENITYCVIFIHSYLFIRYLIFRYLDRKYKQENPRSIISDIPEEVYQNEFRGEVRRLVSGTFLTLYGLSYILFEDWIFSPSRYAYVYQTISLTVKLHYIFEFSHYLISTCLVFIEPHKKDFYVMVYHHLMALSLITYSYYKK